MGGGGGGCVGGSFYLFSSRGVWGFGSGHGGGRAGGEEQELCVKGPAWGLPGSAEHPLSSQVLL